MRGSYSWKILIILIVIVVSVLALIPNVGRPMRLGIDLRGGAELLFKIDTTGLAENEKTGITEKTVDIVRERIDPLDQKGLIIQSRDRERILMQLPGFSREETKDIIALATNLGRLELRLVSKEQDPNKIAVLKKGGALPNYAYYAYSKAVKEFQSSGFAEEGLLVHTNDGYEITGELLKRVFSWHDEAGAPAVSFEFRDEGAKRFAKMTREHIGESVAIVLNGEIYSAPTVKSQITGSGVIEGIRTIKEVDMLVKILNSGSLKCPLVLESEQYVGPTLGENTISAGVKAGIVGSIISLVFIAVYYFFAGAVADFALILNLVILMAFMVITQATLTLPGIAGVLLTIGMAVDANVLIFERFREERRLGRDIAAAVRMGYDKALSAIFDSNLTTFATGVILYWQGTGPIKGFAVTLSVGIAISFFTAVFVTRVIFELMVKYKFLKDLRMIQLFSRTNIPFLGYARYAMLVSLVLAAAGAYVFFAQGKENLDIDFTGGSMAQLQLTQPMGIEEIREKMKSAGYADTTVQALSAEKTEVDGQQDVKGSEGGSGFLGKSTVFALRTQLQEKADIVTFEAAVGREFAGAVNVRAIAVTKRNAAAVRGRNDPFFGGIRYEAQLVEPLPAAKVAEDVAALALGNHELKLYNADPSGALTEAPDGSPSVTVLALRVTGIEENALADKLAKAFTVPNPFTEQVSYIGKQVAEEMEAKATFAIMLALGFTIVYIWFRFGRLSYGLAAVIALAYDVLFTLGAMAVGDVLGPTAVGRALLLGNFKINLPVIAALLTIVGYSVNDKIVVFDRIRENMRLKTKSDWDVINGSINQTLSRTVLTGTTTIVMLVVMYVMGGPGLHSFAYVMLVGVLVGTYSSIFIACPMLVLGEVIKGKPLTGGGSK